MRALILVAAAALTLTACKNNDQIDNTQNVDENLTAENIVSNDVTAIDAVTGDAANMAADSAVNDVGNVSNDSGNAAQPSKSEPKTVSPAKKSAPPPVANSVSNATTNGE